MNEATAKLARGLWDCLVLSGADVSDYDGFEHWARMRIDGMAEEAVAGVRELRESYDEALDEISLPLARSDHDRRLAERVAAHISRTERYRSPTERRYGGLFEGKEPYP